MAKLFFSVTDIFNINTTGIQTWKRGAENGEVYYIHYYYYNAAYKEYISLPPCSRKASTLAGFPIRREYIGYTDTL